MKIQTKFLGLILGVFYLLSTSQVVAQVDSTLQVEPLASRERSSMEASKVIERVEKYQADVKVIMDRYRKGELSQEQMESEIKKQDELLAKDLEQSAGEIAHGKGEPIIVKKEKEVIIIRKTDPTAPDAPPAPPVVSIEKDELTGESKVKVKVKGKPKAPRRTTWGLTFGFGRGLQYPDNEFGRGRYFDIGLVGNTRIGGARSPIYLNYGISQVSSIIEIGDNKRLVMENGQPDFRPIPGAALIRARLNSNHLTGQMGIRIAPGRHERFHLDLLAYSGIRWLTTQELRYRSDQNERVDERRRSRYGTELINYGVMANIGYDWFSLFARYDLSSMFVVNDVHDIKPFSAGIRITLM
jgi:hypothetical protein